jgi:hypothetical protein
LPADFHRSFTFCRRPRLHCLNCPFGWKCAGGIVNRFKSKFILGKVCELSK